MITTISTTSGATTTSGSTLSTRSTRGTGDLRIDRVEPLPTPAELAAALPAGDAQRDVVTRGRDEVAAVLGGLDDRLLVVVGPCSVHDPAAALDYAGRLAAVADRHRDSLLVVLRAYFEKPRTTVGWKGLVNDPRLDGSHAIATGLATARRFLLDALDLGLPCATEFLEPITPQYTADLISWGAIGARTAESQIHRQLASGLSMPVGFKNGTDGSLQVALDGAVAAAAAQTFLGIDLDGRAALVSTTGNPDTHLVLRGSSTGPNYDAASVASTVEAATAAGLHPTVVVDASHGNSGKDHRRQQQVLAELAAQIAAGSPIGGVMAESFLVPGAQRLTVGVTRPDDLTYGQSVTDACLGWDATEAALADLAAAVRTRSH